MALEQRKRLFYDLVYIHLLFLFIPGAIEVKEVFNYSRYIIDPLINESNIFQKLFITACRLFNGIKERFYPLKRPVDQSLPDVRSG